MAGKQARVMMLCTPRSTSTLFARSMTAVPDSEIFADPYFPCHEVAYNLEQVMKRSPDDDDLTDEEWLKAAEMLLGEEVSPETVDINKLKFPYVKHALDNPPKEAPLVFCKQITFPLVGKMHFLPDKSSNYRYSILIRHPLRVFKSLRKSLFEIINQLPALYAGTKKTWEDFHFMRDVPDKYKFKGRLFKELYDQWQYVKENLDPNPVIIDSDDILTDPEEMLTKYCAAMGIPYNDAMTKWAGEPDDLRRWWYPFLPLQRYKYTMIFITNAMFSKGFNKPSRLPSLDDEDLTDDVRESYEIVKPFYEEMYNARLKP